LVAEAKVGMEIEGNAIGVGEESSPFRKTQESVVERHDRTVALTCSAGKAYVLICLEVAAPEDVRKRY
jgi:hypothetical protein